MLSVLTEKRAVLAELPRMVLADPTFWDGQPTADEVHAALTALANDALRTRLIRPLVKLLDGVLLPEINKRITEDGPFADLGEVVGDVVSGLTVDFTPVYAAGDYEARTRALGDALGKAVMRETVAVNRSVDVAAVIAADDRLAHLRAEPENIPDEPPPAKDTDAVPANGEHPATLFFAAVDAAGFTGSDLASALEVSPGYVSQLRTGRKPWPGLSAEAVERLEALCETRNAGLVALVELARSPALTQRADT